MKRLQILEGENDKLKHELRGVKEKMGGNDDIQSRGEGSERRDGRQHEEIGGDEGSEG